MQSCFAAPMNGGISSVPRTTPKGKLIILEYSFRQGFSMGSQILILNWVHDIIWNAFSIVELSDHDDIATAAIIDTYLGFVTHKMNMRFRNPKLANQRQLKKVVEKYIEHQSYERAYKELIGTCDWLASLLTTRRSKLWQAGLREHVS